MSRGHAAALPPAGSRPPDRFTSAGLVVSFRPEEGGPDHQFHFDDLTGSTDLLRAFAAAFARVTAPDGTHRSMSTATTTHQALRRFARRLADSPHPPSTAGGLVPAHLAALRLASPRDYIKVKVVLRDVPGITPAFAAVLREANPPRRSAPVTSLTKAEFSAVMAAARRDIRAARDRIRGNRELLERWHSGVLTPGSGEAVRAKILDHLAVTGDVPREPGGSLPAWVAKAGTVEELSACLYLTLREVVAAAVLLIGLTGHNKAGISTLTVEHTRADGPAGEDAGEATTRVAIVDVSKPRRGRRRRYMTTALADIPDSVIGRPDGPDDLQTPFGVYSALCELTACARQCSGSNRLLISLAVKSGAGKGRHWVYGLPESSSPCHWAAGHGLHREADASKPLVLTWPRLRLTFVRLHQRGVAHTDAVLADQYLLRDRGNINEYRRVVADALHEEEAKARELGRILTLTEEDIRLARTDLAAAAARTGLAPGTLQKLVSGQLDTALAGCVDNEKSPFSESGSPCTASFLLCLRCPNARATPAHLPILALAHQRILALRPAMAPDRWARRFGAAEAQLRHLLSQFPPARVAEALDAATPEHGELIDRLLNGDLDSR